MDDPIDIEVQPAREVRMAEQPPSVCHAAFDLIDVSSTLRIREQVSRLEASMRDMPQAEIPVTNTFCGNTYVRSIVIRKGVVATGRRHRHPAIHLVLVGRMTIITEAGGRRDVEAGSIFVSPPGAKMAGVALEDCIWATVHTVNTQDVQQIERELCYSAEEETQLFLTMGLEAREALHVVA